MEFKFRDKVWLMFENKPIEVFICKVVTIQNDDDRGVPSIKIDLYVRENYYRTPFLVEPEKIFKTKQELLESL